MKNIFFICLFGVLTTSLLAQKYSSKHQFTFSYLGETLTHPGGSILYDYNFYQKRKAETHYLQYISINRLAFYTHPKNHNGWLMTSGLYLQRKQKNGWLLGAGIQAGYQLKLLNEDVYQINNGTVERIRWNKESLFLTGFGARIGKFFSKKNNKNRFGWQLNTGILWSNPFQLTSQLFSIFELGVFYALTPST